MGLETGFALKLTYPESGILCWYIGLSSDLWILMLPTPNESPVTVRSSKYLDTLTVFGCDGTECNNDKSVWNQNVLG